MIEAVIYDLDDLMVDSDPLHFRAWERLFERHGLRFHPPPELHEQLIGRRVVDILVILMEHFDLPGTFEAHYAEREEIFLEIVREDLRALPGLRESLEFFRARGLPAAIASSGTRRYIDLVIEKFELGPFFREVISGDDVTHGKPHPEIYELAARRLGFSPGRCLVLEDAEKGIESAKRAGCPCLAIAGGNTPEQDRSRADLELGSLLEVNDAALETIARRAPAG